MRNIMGKKINRGLNGSVSLNPIQSAKYEGEKLGQIEFKGLNWTENSKIHNIGSGAFFTELKHSIHAGRDYLAGKWNVDGLFHLYAKASERLATGSIGLVDSSHENIQKAKTKKERFVQLTVPGNGTITFEMPLSRDE